MVNIVEVVLELQADGFINSGRTTRGRVLRVIQTGKFTCQVEARVKGVDLPEGPYANLDEARIALMAFWDKCNIALESNPYWQEL